MSVGPIYNVPLVQMGHVEKIVEDMQNQPQMGQYLAQAMAQKSIEKQNEQVQTIDPQPALVQVNPDDKERKDQEAANKKKQQHAAPRNNDEAPVDAPRDGNPWTGIIVNKKV